MTRFLAEALRAAAFLAATTALACELTAAGPEGEYRSDVDAHGCYITDGLWPAGIYTTGFVCPGSAQHFAGTWSLEGDVVHVYFPEGTLSSYGNPQPEVRYDLRWDGGETLEGAGTVLWRTP